MSRTSSGSRTGPQQGTRAVPRCTMFTHPTLQPLKYQDFRLLSVTWRLASLRGHLRPELKRPSPSTGDLHPGEPTVPTTCSWLASPTYPQACHLQMFNFSSLIDTRTNISLSLTSFSYALDGQFFVTTDQELKVWVFDRVVFIKA